MTDPVILRIKRGKSIMLGLLMIPIALIGTAFLYLSYFGAEVFDWMSVLSILIVIVFGGSAVYYLGMAYHQPIALRMDKKGISGYYAEPATWDEIAKIGVFRDKHLGTESRTRFLGFALHDPISFRDRQTAWRRLMSYSSGRSHGYHILIPETILGRADLKSLAARAQALHDAHQTHKK